MKNFFFVILLVFGLHIESYCAPQNIRFSLYAVKDYSKYEYKLSSLDRSIKTKDRFFKEFYEAIQKKYPNIGMLIVHNKENSDATANSFLTDDTDQSEFVLFVGHGNPLHMAFYDRGVTFNVGTKSFGRNTRWVIVDACEFLNVNKEKSDDPRKASTEIDNNRKNALVSMFKGVHAILGSHSKMWQGTVPKHWYNTSEKWRSDDRYEYFAKYFITDGETLKDAYFSAVYKHYDNYVNNHAFGYDTNASGFMSAIAYFYGEFADGTVWDMSKERFGTSYNAPMTSSTAKFSRTSIKIVYDKAGKPKY